MHYSIPEHPFATPNVSSCVDHWNESLDWYNVGPDAYCGGSECLVETLVPNIHLNSGSPRVAFSRLFAGFLQGALCPETLNR